MICLVSMIARQYHIQVLIRTDSITTNVLIFKISSLAKLKVLLDILLLARLITLIQGLHLFSERICQTEELSQLVLRLQDGLDSSTEIEDGLDTAGPDDDRVVAAFDVVPVDPVEDVEAAVEAENEEINTDCHLSLARSVDEDQLRDQGDALEVEGEGPEYLLDERIRVLVLVVDDESEDGARHKQEDKTELVVLFVVCCLIDRFQRFFFHILKEFSP